jgi:hypothetical protein
LIGALSLTSHGATLIPTTTLAATNLPAPGFPNGVNFQEFAFGVINEASNAPLLNNAGHTAFLSTVTGPGVSADNDLVLWSSSTGVLQRIAQEGSQAPGTAPGVTFQEFYYPVQSPTGEVAFKAKLTGSGVTSSNDEGIWLANNGQLQLVARKGSQAVGTPLGANFSRLADLCIASNGRVAFSGDLSGTGVTANNNSGIWSDRGGGLQLAVRKGSVAPGPLGGVVFGGFAGMSFGGNANLAIHALLFGTGITQSNDFGIWRQNPAGVWSLLVREGGQAAGMAGGVVWHNFDLSTPFQTPGINSNGDVVFRGHLFGGGNERRSGIWTTVGGIHPLSVSGYPIAGLPGVTGGGFTSTLGDLQAVINKRGDVAYRQSVNDGGTTDAAVLVIRNSIPQIVAREGDAAPGIPGHEFENFRDLVLLNGEGRVAFRESGNIWAQDRVGVLRLIVSVGDQIEVRPGDIRTVELATLLGGSGGDDGLPHTFSDDGRLAFVAFFTDGTRGMFVSDVATIPEPSALILCLFGIVGFTMRGRRTYVMPLTPQ